MLYAKYNWFSHAKKLVAIEGISSTRKPRPLPEYAVQKY
jgi:hypothetical protein